MKRRRFLQGLASLAFLPSLAWARLDPIEALAACDGMESDFKAIIYNISPTDTPFMSAIARATAAPVIHEWQSDEIWRMQG